MAVRAACSRIIQRITHTHTHTTITTESLLVRWDRKWRDEGHPAPKLRSTTIRNPFPDPWEGLLPPPVGKAREGCTAGMGIVVFLPCLHFGSPSVPFACVLVRGSTGMALEPAIEYGRLFRHKRLQTKAMSPTRNARLGPKSRQRPRLCLVAFCQLLPSLRNGSGRNREGASNAGRKQSLPESIEDGQGRSRLCGGNKRQT